MQVNFLQIILFACVFLIFCHYKFGLRYYCLFLTQFYAMALLGLTGGLSTNLLPLHAFGLALIFYCLSGKVVIRKAEASRYVLLILPFLASLLYNFFFFEPVLGWEIQGKDRDGGRWLQMKESLSLTNITQLIYIVFGMTMALIYSSIPIERRKLKQVIEWTLLSVSIIGTIQIICFYAGIHNLYKAVFYTIDANMVDQGFLWGWKRINGAFQEPSYLGHYLFFTLSFYLLCFGYNEFLRSKAVKYAVIIGILSTATTFYLGAVALLVYMYIFKASKEQKMWYYIIGLVLIPLTLYVGLDTMDQYLLSKSTSTNNRFEMGWTVAWEGIKTSPFFGIAYGTHRPLFIYTQFLSAIGIFGTLFFVGAIISGKTNQNMRHYLLLVFAIGLGAFEMTRHEMWIFFGLLSNPNLYIGTSKEDKHRGLTVHSIHT